MNENRITRALKQWASPDKEFGEELLQRCLTVIDEADCYEIDDSDLEMLAAAGPDYLPADYVDTTNSNLHQ